MITDRDMIEARDDRRHRPAADSLPLWNESYWFSFYDPAVRIGVVTRIGMLPNRDESNVWYYVSKDARIAHTGTDLRCAVPAGDIHTEEERRLLYVALTRARERLVLTSVSGPATDKDPSPFLADIENELVKHQQSEFRRKPEDRQLKLF